MISDLAGMLGDPLMQRALVVACLVGLVAPVIGTYLVQRRLSLLGDGICLLYTSPSPRDRTRSRMPSSA